MTAQCCHSENWHFVVQRAGQVLMCLSLSRLIQSGSVLEARSLALAIRGWVTHWHLQTTSRVQRRHQDLQRRRTSGISHQQQRGALGQHIISGARRTPASTREQQQGTQPSWQKTEWLTARPSLIHSILWRWTAASGTQTAPVDHLACRAGRSVQLDQETTTSGNDEGIC